MKPFAAQAATPSAPLPSGMDAVGLMLGWPSTISSRLTTLSGSRAKAPLCQAVVALAVDPVAVRAGGVRRQRAARENQAGRGGEGRGADRGQPPGAGERAPGPCGR